MITFAGKKFALHTSIGWTLENCSAELTTDRGRLPLKNKTSVTLGVEHCFYVKRLSKKTTEFWLAAKNVSERVLKIKKIVMFAGHMKFPGRAWDVMHAEFFKRDEYFNGFHYYGGHLIRPLKEVSGMYGKSEDTPFPGIFFMHPENGTVLIATLSQEKCKPCWIFDGAGGLWAEDSFSGIPSLAIKPGETFNSEHWILSVSHGKPEDILDDYFRLLKSRHAFPGATSPLREEAVWGSWNYNVRPRGYGDINHAYLAANAGALAKKFKKVRWLMIDDGYQRGCAAEKKGAPSIGVDNFYAPAGGHIAKARFPLGMRPMVDEIVKAGLKPAIWSSPFLSKSCLLARQRPEWLLRFSGERELPGRVAYLDYSLPAVREYIKASWNIIFNEWKFMGLKCDFWTPAFEIPQIEFRNKEHTAVELRNMFLKDIACLKPPGGFLLTCCTVNAGNPFLGLYADASRNGDDISDGGWSMIVSAAKFQSFASLFYRGDCLLADADSIGWCDLAAENENKLWATLAMMTGGMCEIGGDMTNLNHKKCRFYDTVTGFFRPTKKCSHDLLDRGIGRLPISHARLERDDGVFDAYLNWHELAAEVGIKAPGRDIWTSARYKAGIQKIPRRAALCLKLD